MRRFKLSRWLAEHRWYRAQAWCSWLLVVKNAILCRPIIAYCEFNMPPDGALFRFHDNTINGVVVNCEWVE